MGLAVDIYGTLVSVPDKPELYEIEDWGTSNPKEQYWRRKEVPAIFDNVEFDRNGELLLTNEQWEYADKEKQRCFNGFYFLNNGVLTYISGKHYFYLQWWKLEDDIYPDYRDTDRRYFLFLNHWECIKWCLGIVRGKKRREGASSQATANLIYECIFFKNSVCGLISKSEKDSKTTFTNMVAFGYRQLPIFFKPKQLNNADSVTELVFANKSLNTKTDKINGIIDNDLGHRSKVDYRSPRTNSYDSGRLSRGLFDEGGKWDKEAPFSTFIGIVSKTMVKGAKRVGFMECPSTVNEMTKSGGDEYKKVWDSANQFKYDRTPNRLVRYFTPAYDGYVGFIDKYGFSVIDAPNEEQYQYLVENFVGVGDLTEDDIRMGAKAYLTYRRNQKTGNDLEEEIRMNPFDEDEMFMYAGQGCEFNAPNIKKQIQELEDTPPFLRQMRLVPEKRIVKSIFPHKKEVEDVIAKAMDDEKGGWFILELPNKTNHFSSRGGNYYEPLNKSLYQIGVDTTKDMATINGSKPVIIVMKKSCIVEGEETGLYPVAMWIADTRLDIHFDEQVLLACKLYGCTANYEIDARGDYYRYFSKENCGSFLEWTPTVARNPVKRNNKIEPGTRSGDPFQLSMQLQVAKMYVDGTDNEIYNGHIHRIKYITLLKQLLKYDHSNRTPFDQCIALFMALLPMFGEQQKPVIPAGMRKLLPQYKLKVPA